MGDLQYSVRGLLPSDPFSRPTLPCRDGVVQEVTLARSGRSDTTANRRVSALTMVSGGADPSSDPNSPVRALMQPSVDMSRAPTSPPKAAAGV